MPNWLLIVESVLLGLVVALSLPVWAFVAMIFGVTELTPPAAARPIYILLLLFPLVAAGSMIAGFRTSADNPIRWLFAVLPAAHVILLYLVRVRH